jgi:hypothetical protein
MRNPVGEANRTTDRMRNLTGRVSRLAGGANRLTAVVMTNIPSVSSARSKEQGGEMQIAFSQKHMPFQ